LRHETILIVNAARDRIFGNIKGNKKAIAHRGWCPLNCCLLNDPEIIRTMTTDDAKEEYTNNYVDISIISENIINTYLASDSTVAEESSANLAADENSLTTKLTENLSPSTMESQSSAAKPLNLEGRQFLTLIMELYTTDQKSSLRGKLK